MPFIVEIDGYSLDMGDGFGQMAPQDQQKALEEAGEYIKARAGQQKPWEAPAQPEAPKDTSFSSALQSGLDAPLEAIGDTATMLGAESVGGFLKGVTNAPKDYQPAQVVGDREKPWYDPRAYNFSELPRAAVEQLGQVGGSLASRAGGAAVGGAVAGPVGAVAGGLAAPALFEAAQVLGPTARERAKNNGRDTPNFEDWSAAASTAVASGALNAIIPDAKLLRPLVEALTEAGQSVVQQTGETLGTDKGLTLDPHQAVAEGLSAGTSSGGIHVAKPAIKAVNATVAAPFRIAKDIHDTGVLKEQAAESPEQFASDARVQRAYDEEKAAIEGAGTKSVDDVQVFRNLWHRQFEEFRKTAEALHDSGDISPEQLERLTEDRDSVLNTAGKHTQELSQVDLDHINEIFEGRTDDDAKAAKDALLGAARDLNTTVKNAKFKNESGPFERLGKTLEPQKSVLAVATGLYSGNPLIGAAGYAAGKLAGPVGKGVDRALGLQKPDVLRRSRARAKMAEKMGLDTATSLARMSDVRKGAEGRADGVVILPKAYHELTRRRQVVQAQREAASAAKSQAADGRREARRIEADARQAARAEIAKAEAAEKQAVEAASAAKRAEEAAKAKAEAAERQLVDRAQRGVLDHQLSQARARSLAASKVADDAAKAAKVERERIAKQEAEDLKRAAKAGERAAEAEKRSARATDEAAKAEAELQKWTQAAGSTAQRLGAPRLGGWIASTIEHASKVTGVQVDIRDIREAVKEFVDDGRMTKAQAEQLLNVHGAKINKRTNPGLYYEVQDVAALKAAQRHGVNVDRDNLQKAREKAELDETIRRRKRVKSTTKDGRKPEGVRHNEISYRSTVDTAEKALSEAIKTAPEGLSYLATEVASAKTKAEKKAIVAVAKLSHSGSPGALAWIDTQLAALADIGGADNLLAKVKAKRTVKRNK